MRAAWAVLIVVATAADVRADDALAEARRLELALEYDRALAVVDAALAAGGNDPARYLELELLAGKLAAGLDRPDIAAPHFARVLALRPDATLPAGSSPKLTEPFKAARARSIPLSLAVAVTPNLAALRIERDPLGLVVGIAVRTQSGDISDPARLSVALPADTTVLEIAALDRTGNRIWITDPPPTSPTPAIRERSFVTRWPTWAVVAGGTLAIGGLAAWRFRAAQDDWNDQRATADFTTLQDIEQRGRRWGTAANVSFGIAGVSAIAATVFAIAF